MGGRAASEEIMELVEEYVENHVLMNSAIQTTHEFSSESQFYIHKAMELRAKLQAFADEYTALKYCYSPDKVLMIKQEES